MAKKPVDPKNLKLGKLPAKDDPRTLRLANYLHLAELEPPPEKCDWSPRARVNMYANDQIGDCAIAGPANLDACMLAADKSQLAPPTVQDVIRAYSAVSGYRPGRPSTDRGCVLLDVMRYLRRTGIGRFKAEAFVRVDVRNHNLLCQATHLFGGLIIGLNMPAAWQSMSEWLAPSDYHNLRGRWAPNSWGGHCTIIAGYDATRVKQITWGAPKLISYHALDVFCDEAYAVLAEDWFGPDATAPNGFDLAKLRADLKAIT